MMKYAAHEGIGWKCRGISMDSDERSIVDWVNLPEGLAELSFWSTLHDGDLTAIESDLLARNLTLRFDVEYVRNFHKLSDETR
jgi:hypothetical protein